MISHGRDYTKVNEQKGRVVILCILCTLLCIPPVIASTDFSAPTLNLMSGENLSFSLNLNGVTNAAGVSYSLLFNKSVISINSIDKNVSVIGSHATVTSNIDNTNGSALVFITDIDPLYSTTILSPFSDILIHSTGENGYSDLYIDQARWTDSVNFTPIPFDIITHGRINILPLPPIASFTANVTSGIAPLTVLFNDTSSGLPTSWNWSFGDGTYSIIQNLTHTYLTAGTYTVSLNATNGGGSTTTIKTNYIFVDFSSVSMFRADRQHTGIYDDGGITPTNNLKWIVTTGGFIGSSPVIVNNTLFIGSDDGYLYAVNATTGSPVWNTSIGFNIASTPAVADGVVYVGSWDNNTYALNAGNGAILWKTPTGAYVTSSPLVSGGLVYIGSHDGKVYALDAATGAVVWTYVTGSSGINSSPSVANGILYIGSSGAMLHAINASNGLPLWNATTAGQVVSSPAVANGIVYVGSFNNNIYALNATTGGTIWTYPIPDSVDSSPAVSGGVVYVGSDDKNLYALDSTTGAKLWNFSTNGVVYSSPAVANGIVYVGSEDGKIYALNTASGAKLWDYTTGGGIESSPAIYNGLVYIGSGDGKIYALGGTATAPVASFTANVTSGTAPLTVQFNDTSTNSPTNWNWSFGDGDISILQNPLHTYAFSGTFAVSLNATNAGGSNVSTRTNYITVTAPKPIPAFSANVTSGAAPLTVQFTDFSTNSPTGWAWFFGDETYTQPWTRMNASAGWTGRFGHTSVVCPNGSIVLMGGYDDAVYMNDTWRSTDNGMTWSQVNASSGWTKRWDHTCVVLPDGSIVLMGGSSGLTAGKNDTWKSTDSGSTWTLVNASSGWSARAYHTSVVALDGSIILMGGGDNTVSPKNDTWRSTDSGATWTEINASSGWLARAYHSSVVMPDGSIILTGGYDNAGGQMNDTWRSTDNGATWTEVNASSGWSARFWHSTVAMPDSSIVLIGAYDVLGNQMNDIWRSTDNGATWTEVNSSAGWSARLAPRSVVMPDSSIVLMGGREGGWTPKNDVWRFVPTGSSLQSPSHTYTAGGNYQVALQAYNAGGYNSTRQMGYITVTGPAPVASFTANIISGSAPLTVQFNDTSTNTHTSWNWSFGDGTQSMAQHPLHIYLSPGNYTVSLNATNAVGSNLTVKVGYIRVTSPNTPPVASNVTLTSTSGLNRTSDNLTMMWNISDIDGNPVRNITNWYRNSKSITVLNMPFEGGSNSTNIKDYSGYGNSGTDHGAVGNATGGHDGGGAYDFSGTQYISISDSPSLDVNGTGLTVETWVYPRTLTNYMAIVGKESSSMSEPYWVYQLEGFSSGITFRLSTNGNTRTSVDSSPLSTNRWYHVVGTYDGSAIRMYINGELNNSVAKSGNITTSTGKFSIGRFQNGNKDNFNGIVDSVKVYDRALSAEQIRALYLNRSDLIVSQELAAGDSWQGSVTPNDGTEDGIATFSNLLNITGIPPVASFTANVTSGFAPLTVQFNDTSTNTPASWNWSFGDSGINNVSALQNPVHIYTTAGDYTVTLNATNSAGYNLSVKVGYIDVFSPLTSGPVHNLNSGVNYTSIQLAIDNATAFDTILVDSGTYIENVNVSRRLTLIGNNTGTGLPVIDPGTPGVDTGIVLSADNITLDGFVVRNTRDGVYVTGSNATIRHLTSTQNNFGITLDTSTRDQITAVNVTNNTYDGIVVIATTSSTIDNSHVNRNGGMGIGMHAWCHHNTINGTTVDSNNDWGIYLQESYNNSISGNTITSDYYGIVLKISDLNTLSRNNVSNSTWEGIYLDNAVGNTLNNNDVHDNHDNGIKLVNASRYNTLTGNRAFRNTEMGISLDSSGGNNLTANEMQNNDVGISLYNASSSSFIGNNASHNTDYGILMQSDSAANTFSGTIAQWNGIAGISEWISPGNTFTANQLDNNGAGLSISQGSDGATVTGNSADNNTYDGITISDVSGCMISGNTVRRGTEGIAITNGTFSSVFNNNATDNSDYGIILYSHSGWNTFTGNNASGNGIGGINVGNSSHNVFATNKLDRNTYGVMLSDLSTNNTFSSNNISNSIAPAFDIQWSRNTTISHNNIWNNCQWYQGAIRLIESSNTTITANRLWDNYDAGVHIQDNSSRNSITGNVITNHTVAGIIVEYATTNEISRNTLTQSDYGLKLDTARFNIFAHNIIRNNTHGAWLFNSTNNNIFDNAFNNTINVLDDGNNVWNTTRSAGINIINGPYLGGNFWSNYNGVDTSGDGIGNTLIPYTNGGNIVAGGDYLPLTNATGTLVPLASFTANVTSGIAPLSVQFTDTSTNSPTSWNWSFGDGMYSAAQNPAHTYTTIGTFTISLNATNAGGSNTTTRINYITVTTTAPVANFSANVTSGIAPLTVQFTDASTGSPTTRNWSFGDGTYSTEQNPVHTYPSSGFWTIGLTVTNAAGSNTLTHEGYIEVFTQQRVSSSMIPGMNSTGTGSIQNVTLDMTAIGGQVEVTGTQITLVNPGSGWRNVIITACGITNQAGILTATNITGVTLVSNPVAAPLTTAGLGNVSAGFQASFPQFPAGQQISSRIVGGTSQPMQNSFQLVATANNLSITAVGYSLHMQTPPGFNANLTPGSAKVTMSIDHAWVLANGGLNKVTIFRYDDLGTPSMLPTRWLSYNLSTNQDLFEAMSYFGLSTFTLTAATSNSSGSMPITPAANFAANRTGGTIPLAIQFVDYSSNSPTSWYWTFGDGTASSLQNPVHTYSATGNYTVSLTATNAAGTDTVTKPGYIIASTDPPVASFTANTTYGAIPFPVQFNDTSTNTPTRWNWSFGDGIYSAEKNPVHIYTAPGKYTVSLVAGNPWGSSTAIATGMIYVGIAPVVTFTSSPAEPMQNTTVTFNASASWDPDGNITAYVWNFDDGSPVLNLTVPGINHSFADPRVYNVALTGIDNEHLKNTTIGQVSVYAMKVTTTTTINGTDSTTTPAGVQDLTINATTIENTGGNVTSTNTSVLVEGGNAFWTSTEVFAQNVTQTSGGNLSVQNVTEVVQKSAPITAALNETIGNVSVQLTVALDQYVPDAAVEVKIIQGANTSTMHGFQLAATDAQIDIIDVAYTIQLSNTELLNTNRTTNATRMPVVISMNVNHSWVAQFDDGTNNGGRDAITIIRYPETGDPKVLVTQFVSYDPNTNLDSFEADSPGGLSIFGMIGYQAQQAASSQSSQGSQSTGSVSSGGGSRSVSGQSSAVKTDSGKQNAPLKEQNIFRETAKLETDPSGLLADTIRVQSLDLNAYLTLPQGLKAVDPSGQPVTEVTIRPLAPGELPQMESGSQFTYGNLAYQCGPDGARFSPAITLTFTLTDEQWNTLHETGREPVVRGFNKENNIWETVPTESDTSLKTVTAQVSHFSTYAVFSQPAPLTPIITPVPQTPKPPANAFEIVIGMGMWVKDQFVRNPLIGIGVIVLCVVSYVVWQRRKRYDWGSKK